MATHWKYKQGGEEFGPVTSRQLKELAASGRLMPDDLVWKEGLSDWASARRVKGLFDTDATNTAAALSGINLGANVEKLNLGTTSGESHEQQHNDQERHRQWDIPTLSRASGIDGVKPLQQNAFFNELQARRAKLQTTLTVVPICIFSLLGVIAVLHVTLTQSMGLAVMFALVIGVGIPVSKSIQ